MKLKHQIYIFQTVLSALVFLVLTYNYISYKKQYQNDIQEYLESEIQIHKKEILSSITKTNKEFDTQRELFYKIHEDALDIIKKNKNTNLEELKKYIKTNYALKNYEVEIFLIDKSYTIYKTTFPKDLGFNLNVAKDAKYYLDKTSVDSKIYIPKFASTDSLNLEYKLYTYSKLDEESYLELGFINKNFHNTSMHVIAQNINNKNKIEVYNLGKNFKGYYYYNLTPERNFSSKEDFFKSLKTVTEDDIKNDMIVKTGLEFKKTSILKNNIQTIYYPIFEKNVYEILGFENVVMKLEIDLEDKLNFLKEIENSFIISILVIIIFMTALLIFIKSKFTNPIEEIQKSLISTNKIENQNILNLNNELSMIAKNYNNLFDKLSKEINNNKFLLEENKRFIADTVHQIRTPLTNIMMNGEMVKKFQNDETLSVFIDQIDASINMLSNSYEDLAYIVSCDTIDYNLINISVSSKIQKRVKFFDTISKVNSKNIVCNIDKNINFNINEIELERIIDNNISNAIKYAQKNKDITINLKKENESFILEFISHGVEIKDKQKVFEKNYREVDAKRGLGLGLNMVKNICEKYDVSYKTYYDGNRNIFEYIFKN